MIYLAKDKIDILDPMFNQKNTGEAQNVINMNQNKTLK